jgi:hypothetical protein
MTDLVTFVRARLEWDGQGQRPTYAGMSVWRTVVKHLAVIDDSHPDYDESWRP